MEDLTGKILGQYQITGALGEGGMAAVYKAYQPGIDRYVALKILPRHFASDPLFIQRFQQEARIIAKLQHPHILPVHDYGEQDGYTYIVMPYVETGTLADLIQGEPLCLEQIKTIMTQVGDALDYAHAHGVVHRDVKPTNVLVDERGNCMLTDFGIGKILTGATQLTRTGDVIGTPAYMSPEQGLGKELDGRSDIYALGVMLYEMATGRQPFRAETPMAVIIKHINDPLPPPRMVNPVIPELLEKVILKALAKDRDQRFATAGEMVQSLVAAISSADSQGALPSLNAVSGQDFDTRLPKKLPSPSSKTSRIKRRISANWIIAGIAGVAAIGIIAVISLMAVINRFWLNAPNEDSPVDTKLFSPSPTLSEAVVAAPDTVPTDTAAPVINYDLHPNKAAYVFDKEGLVMLGPAIQWVDNPEFLDIHQADVLLDPKAEFNRVVRLSVQGYGHGEQTAWITVRVDVPPFADIIIIPVATALNGPVEETDSESGLEIRMRNPDTGQESWTYAAYLYETQLGVPYVYAFADASPFQGKEAELMIRLRQVDVCAGSLCTHDADFFIGDLFFGELPDICTRQSNGILSLYDYFDDPTPEQVATCDQPVDYYFVDIEEGPYNQYGAGEKEYSLTFSLPENSELINFRLYYGYYTRGLTLNNHSWSAAEVYEAFPLRSGVYLNIAEPSRYSLMNRNREFLKQYFVWGKNNFSMVLYTEKHWEEQPFDVFMRFKVAVP